MKRMFGILSLIAILTLSIANVYAVENVNSHETQVVYDVGIDDCFFVAVDVKLEAEFVVNVASEVVKVSSVEGLNDNHNFVNVNSHCFVSDFYNKNRTSFVSDFYNKNRTSLESHKNYTKENVFGTPVNLATNIYSDAEKPVGWK
jgi:hypothetical protein